MNRQENEKRQEDFKLFLKNSALFTTSAANFLKNYQYDKWFDKLKRTNYLSNFMSWFNKKTMNEQDYNDEEIIEGETEDVAHVARVE